MLNTPGGRQCPSQVAHRVSGMDGYFAEDEGVVRRMQFEDLMRRAEGVFGLWWGVVVGSAWLGAYEAVGWRGIEREFSG